MVNDAEFPEAVSVKECESVFDEEGVGIHEAVGDERNERDGVGRAVGVIVGAGVTVVSDMERLDVLEGVGGGVTVLVTEDDGGEALMESVLDSDHECDTVRVGVGGGVTVSVLLGVAGVPVEESVQEGDPRIDFVAVGGRVTEVSDSDRLAVSECESLSVRDSLHEVVLDWEGVLLNVCVGVGGGVMVFVSDNDRDVLCDAERVVERVGDAVGVGVGGGVTVTE